VHRRRLELALDDEVGLLEAGLEVALLDLDALGDVRGLLGLGLDADGERSSCRSGAFGCIASTTSITCGSTSYFTSMSLRARRAMAALVAATAATAWPSYSAFSRAMTFRTTSL